jgi:hypothetical protein
MINVITGKGYVSPLYDYSFNQKEYILLSLEVEARESFAQEDKINRDIEYALLFSLSLENSTNIKEKEWLYASISSMLHPFLLCSPFI